MSPVTKEEEARARKEIEGRATVPSGPGAAGKGAPEPSEERPAAGPHANSDLINPDATPGTGALPTPGGHDDVDSTSG